MTSYHPGSDSQYLLEIPGVSLHGDKKSLVGSNFRMATVYFAIDDRGKRVIQVQVNTIASLHGLDFFVGHPREKTLSVAGKTNYR